MSDDNVIPLHPAPPAPSPQLLLRVDLVLMPDGGPAVIATHGPTDPEAVGDLLLKAAYIFHKVRLEGIAVIALSANDTNFYYDNQYMPWRDPRLQRWLRGRLDDIYKGLTGKHRSPLHWLRKRKAK